MSLQATNAATDKLAWTTPELIELGSADDVTNSVQGANDGSASPQSPAS